MRSASVNSLASSMPSSPAARAPTTLELPSPPSTNQLYSGRRFKTKAYKAWIHEAGWELTLQRVTVMHGPFQLTIWMPGRADLDNIKAIPDLLKTMGVIVDDSPKYMRRLVIEVTDGQCRVEIVPL
jgi:crossover junction endodeoxyribonuclease RusA